MPQGEDHDWTIVGKGKKGKGMVAKNPGPGGDNKGGKAGKGGGKPTSPRGGKAPKAKGGAPQSALALALAQRTVSSGKGSSGKGKGLGGIAKAKVKAPPGPMPPVTMAPEDPPVSTLALTGGSSGSGARSAGTSVPAPKAPGKVIAGTGAGTTGVALATTVKYCPVRKASFESVVSEAEEARLKEQVAEEELVKGPYVAGRSERLCAAQAEHIFESFGEEEGFKGDAGVLMLRTTFQDRHLREVLGGFAPYSMRRLAKEMLAQQQGFPWPATAVFRYPSSEGKEEDDGGWMTWKTYKDTCKKNHRFNADSVVYFFSLWWVDGCPILWGGGGAGNAGTTSLNQIVNHAAKSHRDHLWKSVEKNTCKREYFDDVSGRYAGARAWALSGEGKAKLEEVKETLRRERVKDDGSLAQSSVAIPASEFISDTANWPDLLGLPETDATTSVTATEPLDSVPSESADSSEPAKKKKKKKRKSQEITAGSTEAPEAGTSSDVPAAGAPKAAPPICPTVPKAAGASAPVAAGAASEAKTDAPKAAGPSGPVAAGASGTPQTQATPPKVAFAATTGGGAAPSASAAGGVSADQHAEEMAGGPSSKKKRKRSRGVDKMTCGHCQRQGHLKKDCPDRDQPRAQLLTTAEVCDEQRKRQVRGGMTQFRSRLAKVFRKYEELDEAIQACRKEADDFYRTRDKVFAEGLAKDAINGIVSSCLEAEPAEDETTGFVDFGVAVPGSPSVHRPTRASSSS